MVVFEINNETTLLIEVKLNHNAEHRTGNISSSIDFFYFHFQIIKNKKKKHEKTDKERVKMKWSVVWFREWIV